MYATLVFLPLIGFLCAGLGGRILGARFSGLLTSSFLVVAASLSWVSFFLVGFREAPLEIVPLFPFLSVGDLEAAWSLRVDTLTSVMLVVVTTISALVHIYSIGYMHEDPHQPRFFAYLSLFTFAMLMLVTADNLVQLFFGWEGVGLASYLLIGFWYQRPSANAAAIKAFIVNRVGDFGFLLGIFGVFLLFRSVAFGPLFETVQRVMETPSESPVLEFMGMALGQAEALTVVCLLLFMGAMGKSAQFLLHTWLPDAMEGPTPVSALIHAATMVTAGVFMVARLSPLFEFSETALTVVTFFGAITAFFAATVALVQNDIKRIIAYSTCSQLGYMFVALGVGAYSVGIFHLFTHAFFKALLFLGAGSVIHAVSNEQDIRKMGGLWRSLPVTYGTMVIGTLALTGVGIPGTSLGFAGFVSKDSVIEAAFAGRNVLASFAFWITVLSALLTAFYSWRLVFLTFHGRCRAEADVQAHLHESPPVMTIPLLLLAVGSVGAGTVFGPAFIGDFSPAFWRGSLFMGAQNHVLEAMHHVPLWVKVSPFVAMALGLLVAWLFYIRRPEIPRRLRQRHQALYAFLLNKWYFDEIYDVVFVRSAFWLGRLLWLKGDGRVIDGLGPDGIAARVQNLTRVVMRLQTGYMYHYAFVMLIGLAALMTWMLFLAGGTQ